MLSELFLTLGPAGGVTVTPLAIIVTLLLIMLLATRELAASVDAGWRGTRYLGVAIVPLLLVFMVIVADLLIAFVQNPLPLH